MITVSTRRLKVADAPSILILMATSASLGNRGMIFRVYVYILFLSSSSCAIDSVFYVTTFALLTFGRLLALSRSTTWP